MTSARVKRLRQLEQVREERTREHVEALTVRAMERMNPEQLEALGWENERQGTPEYAAALERLRVWGEQVPEYREAPDLGTAAREWLDKMNKAGPFSRVPVASPGVSAEFEENAERWAAIAEREDCPEPEAARGQAAGWSWWAAVAWASRQVP